jgi:LuxR family transcriptional regulator, maltose regulon positive regulatory protein
MGDPGRVQELAADRLATFGISRGGARFREIGFLPRRVTVRPIWTSGTKIRRFTMGRRMHVTGATRYSGIEQVADCDGNEDDDTPVAAAKVRIPVVAPTTLIRERLHHLLDSALAHTEAGPPVTVVCAPVGTGKTTMLAGWARQRAEPGDAHVAWVSIDNEDNDPALLWLAILRALRGSGAWDQDCPLDRLTPPPGEPYATFLNAVIAALEQVPQPVILVLDGVHDVQSVEPVRALDILLRHTPATLRIVLAARFPPPLILPRLKLEGRLREIGPGDLAFTREEARHLYASEGIRLPETELGLLMERTEGWAAGLRLAAITVADSARPAELITGFTGDSRVVADYLLGEVLARQPEDVQQFMLSTCVCRTFTADLAAVLSRQENAGQILDRLEHTSILVGKGEGARRWYRYHPLLRGYLRAELGRRRQSAGQELHRLAADWFLDAGDSLRAMEHGVAAEDDDLVTRLVGRSGLEQILKGQSGKLRAILDTAPARVLNRPSVALVAAAAALDLGDLIAADRWLRAINTAARPLRTQRSRALHATVLLQRSRLQGNVSTALTALRATKAGHTGDLDLDLFTLVNRGIATAWTGHHQAAKDDLQHALRLAVTEQRDAAVLQSKAHLAALAGAEGELTQMGEQATAAIEFAESRGWGRNSRSAYLYLLLAAEAYQRLEDDRARRLVKVATELMPRSVDPTIELTALTLHAMIMFDTAEHPHEIAAALREHWQRLGGASLAPALIAHAAPPQQRMALRVGEYSWALEVLQRVEDLSIPCGESGLLRAILHAHKGKTSSTRRLLAPILTGEIRTLAVPTVIDAWLLEAHLADRSLDYHRAHEALSRAPAIAAPRNALRPFRDAGHSIHTILARGAGRFGRLEPFATQVRTALPASVPDPTDGLTEREQALLVELPSMRTAEEIASTMFVSVNTVKTHLRGIYRKLGVSQRRTPSPSHGNAACSDGRPAGDVEGPTCAAGRNPPVVGDVLRRGSGQAQSHVFRAGATGGADDRGTAARTAGTTGHQATSVHNRRWAVSSRPAGRLWAGGLATAVVAALIAIAGILIARGALDVAVLAPKGDGLWGNANTATYALAAAGAALAATALLHLLTLTTPRHGQFFTWIMVLLTAIAATLPLTLDFEESAMLATAVINLVIGIAIMSILNGIARSATRES